MKTPSALGTVLPTRSQLARADALSDEKAAADRAFAASVLGNAAERCVGGESRFYVSSDTYATARNGRLHWFQTRTDGDYSIAAPVNS